MSEALVIGGDICPRQSSVEALARGDADRVLGEVVPRFRAAAYSIVNLEAPVASGESLRFKSGVRFGIPGACVDGLASAGLRAVGLANNHIRDYGGTGVAATLARCHAVGLDTVGAGADEAQALEPLQVTVGKRTVALFAFSDAEFGTAGPCRAGGAVFDPFRIPGLFRGPRQKGLPVVVLLHSGAEHYPLPSPRLQAACRFLADEGARAVVCQHSHCAGCWEEYGNSVLVYGQGNLVDDAPGKRPPAWHRGFLVELTFDSPDRPPGFSIVPYTQYLNGEGVRLLEGTEQRAFLRELHARCEQLGDPELLGRRWRDYCRARESVCFSNLAGHGRWRRSLNHRTNYLARTYSNEEIARLLNQIRSQVHREILETVLWQTVERRGLERTEP